MNYQMKFCVIYISYLLPYDLIMMNRVSWKYHKLITVHWNNFDTTQNKKFMVQRYIDSIKSSLKLSEFIKSEDTQTSNFIGAEFIKLANKLIEDMIPEIIKIFTFEELTYMMKMSCTSIAKRILAKQCNVNKIMMPKLTELVNIIINQGVANMIGPLDTPNLVNDMIGPLDVTNLANDMMESLDTQIWQMI